MEGYQAVFWHWWIFAIMLVVLEIFAPGTFFLWLGVSAGVIGLVLLVFPDLAWEVQVIGFSVVSVASILVWRRWFLEKSEQSEEPLLNQRGAQYVGRVFQLDEGIVNGVGKVHVDDTQWRVKGEDCPAGSRVRVTGVDGVMLEVACLPEDAE